MMAKSRIAYITCITASIIALLSMAATVTHSSRKTYIIITFYQFKKSCLDAWMLMWRDCSCNIHILLFLDCNVAEGSERQVNVGGDWRGRRARERRERHGGTDERERDNEGFRGHPHRACWSVRDPKWHWFWWQHFGDTKIIRDEKRWKGEREREWG